jgi:hypothetical protein
MFWLAHFTENIFKTGILGIFVNFFENIKKSKLKKNVFFQKGKHKNEDLNL